MNAFLLLQETTSKIIMFAIVIFYLYSFEMSMIVVDDYLNFIIQIHLTNYVSDIGKNNISGKMYKNFSHTVSRARESQRNCVLSTI